MSNQAQSDTSLLHERHLPLHEAAKLPVLCGTNLATLYRWCDTGCRGIKLKSLLIGGRRVIKEADLVAFIEATTAAGERDRTAQPASPAKVSRRRAAAEQRADQIFNRRSNAPRR